MKLITPSALVERLKINGSLARAACKFLAEVCLINNIVFILISYIYININKLSIIYLLLIIGRKDFSSRSSSQTAYIHKSNSCLKQSFINKHFIVYDEKYLIIVIYN